MADGLLKLCGEPSVPGLALPKAFESLEKNIETVTNLCKMKGPSPSNAQESQVTSVLLVCKELQRLLRLAFVENGILASRIEMLSYYQDDFIRRCEKKIKRFSVEQKISRRYLKKLRQRQLKFEKKSKKKDDQDWTVEIACSDYDTVFNLSRICGSPDLEFMLRMNQLLLDFVKDSSTNELFLPPMGSEERAELSKLASLYKLRCRFNKSTQVASSVIIKARQTCLPASGEIDNLLNSFTKKIKDGIDHIDLGSPKSETEKDDTAAPSTTNPPPSQPTSTKEKESSAPPTEATATTSTTTTNVSSPLPAPSSSSSSTTVQKITPVQSLKGILDTTIPSYMLTPVSSIGTPTITLEGGDPSLVGSGFTSGALSVKPIADEGRSGGGAIAESPIPLPSTSASAQTKSPRIDTTTTSSVAQSLLKLLPDALDPNYSNNPSSQANKSFINLASKGQSSAVPSTPPLYPGLYPPSSSTGLTSSSAFQMALLMQSHQQLRALNAAAAAVTGGNQGSPLPVTTAPPMTPPASSGRSTVLATPLPMSFTGGNKSPISGIKRSGVSGDGGVTAANKKPKVNRRSYTIDPK